VRTATAVWKRVKFLERVKFKDSKTAPCFEQCRWCAADRAGQHRPVVQIFFCDFPVLVFSLSGRFVYTVWCLEHTTHLSEWFLFDSRLPHTKNTFCLAGTDQRCWYERKNIGPQRSSVARVHLRSLAPMRQSKQASATHTARGVGLGSRPISRNFMKATPRHKWYLTTGRRFH